MPRLTNSDYIAAHEYLHKIWKRDNGMFALLSYTDQMTLHDYFVPAKKLSKEDLLTHRTIMTRASPSLPHRAGKVLVRCRQSIEEARLLVSTSTYPQLAAARPSAGDRRVIVTSVARDTPDMRKLVRALILISNEEMAKEQK